MTDNRQLQAIYIFSHSTKQPQQLDVTLSGMCSVHGGANYRIYGSEQEARNWLEKSGYKEAQQ